MKSKEHIMPFIERLLNGAEVEWITLGDNRFIEIANNNRRPVKSSNRTVGNIPYYGANNIQDYVDGYTHHGTYILVAEDGTASLTNYSVQWATGKFWANNHVHVLRAIARLDSRFVYHYLHTVNFIPYLTGGGRAKLTKGKLLEIPVPIPPLSVQQEIVRILDKFTTLEAELEAELDCRKRQYEYYRNQLLSFDMLNKKKGNGHNNETIMPFIERLLNGAKVEWKPLGEVLKRSKGIKITASQMKEKDSSIGEVKIFAGGKTFAMFRKEDVPVQCIIEKPSIIVKSRGIIEFEYYNKPFSYKNEFWSYYCDNDKISLKYIYYYLKKEENYFQNIGSKMQMPQISIPVTDKFPIPIPPLSVQEEIVRILDKFDTLTSSISEGLPKEIVLRRKQYEYYRDRLLSFPKP